MVQSVLAHFGAELRLYRSKAGYTQEELGEACGYSNGLISQVERATRMPSEQLAASLDRVLGTDGTFSRMWPLVHDQSAPVKSFRTYLERESTASAIHTYEPQLIPGLLQTEDYARAVVQAGRPAPRPAEVDARVALRMTRQDILTRERPLWLWAVIGEAALHIRTGSTRIMAAQLQHVLRQSELPNVTVQVLPFSAGIGPALGLAYLVAEFPDGTSAYHADAADQFSLGAAPADVADRRKTFDHLRALSLPEGDSAARVAARAKEWNQP